ncbi:MAG TPA: DUF87 domain-containing protein [Xanthobacteraceae bacterium]|jgi:hypothetical protein
MRADIWSAHIQGSRGWDVHVRLKFDEDDHHFIVANNMHDFVIARHKEQPDHTFNDFYQATYTTVHPTPSKYQADQLVALLEHGFKEFTKYLEENRTPSIVSPRPEKPWNFFDDKTRFEHSWIVAGTGSGKTTLLSALINEDLDKVARGEASVMVIDSQNEHLGRYLPHLTRFGRGGDLEGKLIYLEPDLNHPLALNIFDFKGYDKLSKNQQMEALRTVEDMVIFFVGALIGELTGHMRNILGYALQAMVCIPDATVFTFKELLAKGGMARLVAKYPQLTQLDADTQRFLDTGLLDYGPSIASVRTRLDAITRDPFTKATFAQPRNTFNLYDILSEPHVIVCNTNSKLLGSEATGLFGRYFLASLLRVVRRRQSGGFPCYVFADEAQQYIAQEEAVVDLINEARRQQIALTFAHHRMSDIKPPAVASALHSAAIRIEPAHKKQHQWTVTIRNGDPEIIKPPPVNFEHLPQMPRPEWTAIMDDMHTRFSPEPPKTISHNSSEPLPDADAR